MTLAVLLAAALALVTASPAPDSTRLTAASSELREGDRVRVTAPDAGLRDVVGIFQEVTEESVSFWRNREGVAVGVPREQIDQLELFDGMVSRGELFATASVAGLGIGALTGAVVGALSGDDNCDPQSLCFDRAETAIILGIVGAGAGLTVGMLVGILRDDKERWIPVTLTLAPLMPTPGTSVRPGLVLSRSF